MMLVRRDADVLVGVDNPVRNILAAPWKSCFLNV